MDVRIVKIVFVEFLRLEDETVQIFAQKLMLLEKYLAWPRNF